MPEQIAAVREAEVVLGPSGAAFANMVFQAPGGRLVEIRPAAMEGPWMALGAANLGLAHEALPARAGPGEVRPGWRHRLAQLPRRLAGRYGYCYEADIDAVLAALG